MSDKVSRYCKPCQTIREQVRLDAGSERFVFICGSCRAVSQEAKA